MPRYQEIKNIPLELREITLPEPASQDLGEDAIETSLRNKINRYNLVNDIVESRLGQWQYPNQITKVNSSNITMSGVSQPLLGVDNLGNSQIMLPEQQYKFPGSFVTEFPLNKI